jgi:DNA-binding NarL/FixJ family response regulator
MYAHQGVRRTPCVWSCACLPRLSLSRRVVEPSQPADVAALLSDAYGLPSRETEVVGLVARGHTNAEITRLLWLSPWTAGDHAQERVREDRGAQSR